MRGKRLLLALAAVAALAGAGCQGMGMKRSSRALAAGEPGLDGAAGGPAVVEGPPARSVTWVDRHPLFSKPRDYYENSGENQLVKAGAATVIGIPAGIFGEMRQIVVGRPAQPY